MVCNNGTFVTPVLESASQNTSWPTNMDATDYNPQNGSPLACTLALMLSHTIYIYVQTLTKTLCEVSLTYTFTWNTKSCILCLAVLAFDLALFVRFWILDLPDQTGNLQKILNIFDERLTWTRMMGTEEYGDGKGGLMSRSIPHRLSNVEEVLWHGHV